MPIALRLAVGKEFCQGPFKIGVLQPVVNTGAIVYMVVSVVSASMLSSLALKSGAVARIGYVQWQLEVS